MKKSLTYVLSLVSLFLLFASPTMADEPSRWSEIQERGTLIAGVRQDNAPHSFINNQGEWVGFDVDIAQAIAEHLDLNIEMTPVNELTRITYLQNGTIDIAAASMSHTWSRDEQVDFSQTYFWSNQTFLVRADDIASLADLVGKPVAVSRGSHAIGNWQRWLESGGHTFDRNLVLEFDDKQIAVQAVKNGTVAGWAEDMEVLSAYAQSNPDFVVLLDESIGVKQDGIGIRENESQLRDRINYALQRIEVSGEYDVMHERWFGAETATAVPITNRIEVWPGDLDVLATNN